MEYKTVTAASGIVRCDIFSENFKVDCITVELYAPLDKKSATQISLLSSVLTRANSVYGEMDKINAFLEKNYGASFSAATAKTGELQSLCFSARFLDDRFAIDGESVSENMASLMRAAIFEPVVENGGFCAKYVEQEKRNLRDRIQALINDKRLYSLEKCKQVMFENESYGVYEQGDIEMLENITPQSLYEFYISLLDTAAVFVSYAGIKRDADGLLKPITDRFKKAERRLPQTSVCNAVTELRTVCEDMAVEQSKLNIGFRLGEYAQQNIFAARMFNVIFGGSPTSKLFMNVRERMSLCYYCSSACDFIKNIMLVYSGVETSKADAAEKEILNQLQLMKNGEISDTEFENARAYLIDSYIQAGDSLSALSAMQTSAYIMGHGLSVDEQIERIKAVTPEQVIKIAGQVTADTVYLLRGTGGESNAD